MEDRDIVRAKELLTGLLKRVSVNNRRVIEEVLDIMEPFFSKAEKRLERATSMSYLYKGFDPVTSVAKIAASLGEVPALYAEAKRDLQSHNKATQDILHALELLDLTEEQRTKLTEDLIELRRSRRAIKNFLELIEPFNDLVSRNSSFVSNLGKTQAKVHTMLKDMEGRRYNVRVREDLSDLFDALASQGVALSDDDCDGEDE